MAKSKQHKVQQSLLSQAGADIKFPNEHTTQLTCVDVRQTESGLWEVRSQSDRRGGLFRDYRSAARFIKHEFQSEKNVTVVVNGGDHDLKSKAA